MSGSGVLVKRWQGERATLCEVNWYTHGWPGRCWGLVVDDE